MTEDVRNATRDRAAQNDHTKAMVSHTRAMNAFTRDIRWRKPKSTRRFHLASQGSITMTRLNVMQFAPDTTKLWHCLQYVRYDGSTSRDGAMVA